jgi:hypothetical protein
MPTVSDVIHAKTELEKAYRTCFNSPAGRMVLNDLKKEYLNNRISDTVSLEMQMGQHNLVYDILERIGEV